ncbi:DNA-processing protein DprA [Ramlibacter sp. Leaf400]|uniref:DNA-processing protein DprA n=1 Tax=Ramlibacter sp. Leaf400 TaxID=1736365 RepID=UPI0006F5C6EB|nr:DNA-processing protein DprA [Ramlibacter sp. Leaf400]KQT12403.1 DNA processing protein DprA [Ramlibacter sp. Leaf400]
MERDELAAWLRLALTPGVGRGSARRLLAAFGLPQQVFAQDPEALATVAGPAQVQALRAEPDGWAAQVDVTWDWLQQDSDGSRRLLTLADPAYPQALLQTEDPPLMLYVQGVAKVQWPQAIAIVGSRNPTPQGRANAQQFGRTFAQAGWTVVSGMALGIDAAAHEGALEGSPPGQIATIAVVGTGLDRVYPSQHRDLAHRITGQGLIVSEYPLGTPPLSENFPQRNRIIAALGQGTLVVEAAVRSGSLITARMAAEQGREVFAVPGSIHSPQARGCHELLRQGAKLVETAQDVLEELAPATRAHHPRLAAVPAAPVKETSLLQALGHDPVGLDALIARTGTSAADLQAQLLEMELEGHVARLPGGLFQRLERG